MFVDRDCIKCPIRTLLCFATLPLEDIESFSFVKCSKSYKKGQIIYNEGQKPGGVYCINEGKVKIFRLGLDGKEQIVRFAVPGDLFGLRALIGGASYSTSSTAIEDSVVCLIPKSDFFRIIVKYPEISQRIMVMLSQMVDNAESKLLSIAQKPVRERLAETLIALHNMFNKDQLNSSINLTRTDLANIVGTANETVIRLLAEFKEENLIYVNGRKITIYDFEGLRKIAKVL
jgi:CRP-like cAMP-binding protein